MTAKITQSGIISDADVLIDYAKSAPDVLSLVSTYVRKLYVTSPVLREVDQLSTTTAEALKIDLIEPTLTQLVDAAAIRQQNPALSGQDALCFILARDNGWACLTNDKALRKYCSSNHIACLWGLEILRHVVATGRLTPQEAFRIAQDFQSKNRYIHPNIVSKFKKQLGL